jgi:hypothetical protein|nr:MAG TPA: hypothetical protein [Caudoviricetes sp.]
MIIVRTDDAIYTGGEAFYLEKLEYEDKYTVVFANEEAVDITEPLDLEEARKVLDRITDRIKAQQEESHIVIDMREH